MRKAVKKKKVVRKKVTQAGLKASMLAKGYRLPHGYQVVKRIRKKGGKK